MEVLSSSFPFVWGLSTQSHIRVRVLATVFFLARLQRSLLNVYASYVHIISIAYPVITALTSTFLWYVPEHILWCFIFGASVILLLQNSTISLEKNVDEGRTFDLMVKMPLSHIGMQGFHS